MFLLSDAPAVELLVERLTAEKHRLVGGCELALQLLRSVEELQADEHLFVERIALLGLAEQLQEVQPRLAVGGVKRGEQFVADVRADGVLAAVPGRGVVGVQHAADLAGRGEQGVFLGMQGVVPL
jgi:hypothetical protein